MKTHWLVIMLVLLATLTTACNTNTPPPVPTAAPTEAPKATAPAPAQPTAVPASPTALPAAPTAVPTARATAAPTAAPTTAPATAAVKAPAQNIVRINVGSYPDNFDPQQIFSFQAIGVASLLYESLLVLSPDLTPTPGAAEKWDVSADGLTYTFKLRSGLKYSDGQPLTAKNFEYALKRAADPILAGAWQFGTFDIDGALEYASADAKTTSKADLQKLRDAMGVKAVNDTTLQIKLVKKAAYFPYIATLWIGMPVREDIIAKGETWWTKAENHIGNGPFMLKELKEKDSAVFVPNPNWHGPKPMVDQIIYRYIPDDKVAFEAYKNGELDITPLQANNLAVADKDAVLSKEIYRQLSSCTLGLAFNATRPPFDKRDVRMAFAKAIDRDAWARDVLGNLAKPAVSWIPAGVPGANPTSGAAQKFDPTEAKALLAKAGFPNGQGLPEIKLTYGSSPVYKTQVEFLAAQLQKNLGVPVIPDPVELTSFFSLVNDVATNPQLSITGGCSDYPDPQNWLSSYWRSTGFGAKRYGYKNEAFDKLVDAADIETDNTKRLQLYQQAEKMLLEDDAAMGMLSQNMQAYLIKPYIAYGKISAQDNQFPGWFEPWKLGIKR